MKKTTSLFLAIILCLSMLTSCSQNTVESPAQVPRTGTVGIAMNTAIKSIGKLNGISSEIIATFDQDEYIDKMMEIVQQISKLRKNFF